MTGNADFVLPEWMKQYTPLFTNTGGWDVEDLMREQVNARTNLPVAMLQVAVESQIILLAGLNAADKLPDHKLIAAAEMAYEEINAQIDPMDYDDPQLASLCAAHAALYEALGKAPAPEIDDDGSNLPL